MADSRRSGSVHIPAAAGEHVSVVHEEGTELHPPASFDASKGSVSSSEPTAQSSLHRYFPTERASSSTRVPANEYHPPTMSRVSNLWGQLRDTSSLLSALSPFPAYIFLTNPFSCSASTFPSLLSLPELRRSFAENSVIKAWLVERHARVQQSKEPFDERRSITVRVRGGKVTFLMRLLKQALRSPFDVVLGRAGEERWTFEYVVIGVSNSREEGAAGRLWGEAERITQSSLPPQSVSNEREENSDDDTDAM